MKSYFIETYDLNKWYKEVMALNKISVKIDRGIVGLLGPNGAGKSTFLNIATAQLRQSSGEIYVEGNEVWNNPDILKKFGFCPEQETLFDWMTGRKFVRELALLSGLPREVADKAACEAIDIVGLTDSQDRAIGGYSKGMRQRIKIAQAIVHNPEILFLDEPLQSTDPIVRRELVELIQSLGRDFGKNILISSHILHEVERVTSSILLIYAGKAIAQGNIADIRDLMEKYPLTVRVGTTDRKKLATLLLDYDFILNLEMDFNDPKIVYIRTDSPDQLFCLLPELVMDSKIEITEMSSEDAGLEAIFQYLTRGR
ncbi:MAG: ABC transporter ATP-binding protein [Asgard group archaeon]|nr:ABC transporter ATP-binding protein [Asgard group archaeon]